MVIFRSYVSLPEGSLGYICCCFCLELFVLNSPFEHVILEEFILGTLVGALDHF